MNLNSQPKLRPSDLENSKSLKCENCENEYFMSVVSIKIVSAIMSPTGKEIHVPIQTFACSKCSHVNKELVPSLSP